MFLVLSGLLFVLDSAWETPQALLHNSLVGITSQASAFDAATATTQLAHASWRLLTAWWPIAILFPVAGMLGWIAQRGWIFVPGDISPDAERLNPIAGLARMFSLAAWRRGISTILKVALLGGIAWLWAADATRSAELLQGPNLSRHLSAAEPQRTAPVLISGWQHTQQLAARFSFALATGLLGWGLLDFLLQRRAYERELSMTRQELREELAQQNLAPAIRDRIQTQRWRLTSTNRRINWADADLVLHAGSARAVVLRFRPTEDSLPIVLDTTESTATPRLLQTAASHSIPTRDDGLLTALIWNAHLAGQPIPESACRQLAETLASLSSRPP